MHSSEFERIFEEQVDACRQVLINKAKEYAADDDRLHNFRVAAALEGVTMRQALAGIMVKHTVSVYDLCRSESLADRAMWEEKVGDHLNYLFLLMAVITDEERSRLPL